MASFSVIGTPAPMGSARAIRRGTRAILVASSSDSNARNQRAWKAAVAREADRASKTAGIVKGPVAVSIVFMVSRPAGHYGTGRNAGRLRPSSPAHPTVKPDLDKLARATLDALTGRLFVDDSNVVSLYLGKQYGEPTGAHIRVSPFAEGLNSGTAEVQS